MRIGLVIERMEPWRGGAETSTAQFAAELVSRGEQVVLFTTSRGVSAPGVQVHTVDVPRGRTRRAGAFARGMAAALAESPCDIVHSMTPLFGGDVFMPRGGTVAETIEGNIRVRRSAWAREFKRLIAPFNRHQQAMLRLERELLTQRLPARVVALSDCVSDQLSRHYGLDAARVVKVFNAVHVSLPSPDEAAAARSEIRSQWSISPDAMLLLFAAHNFRLKGLAETIDACGVLSQRQPRLDWHLVVVGHDKPGPYVRRADRWGIHKRVAFAGPSERMERFYHASDVLVLPTFYDPCSRVVLESVSLGVPAITSRFNGASEILLASDGRPAAGAVIADPHDAGELAAAMFRFADAAARRAASAAGLALRPQLSMKRHADEMMQVYEQVLEERGTRNPERGK